MVCPNTKEFTFGKRQFQDLLSQVLHIQKSNSSVYGSSSSIKECWVMWSLVVFNLVYDLTYYKSDFVGYKYHCFILGFEVFFWEMKNYTAVSCIFFLKIVKLVQLCGCRQIAKPRKYCFVWLFSLAHIFFYFRFS